MTTILILLTILCIFDSLILGLMILSLFNSKEIKVFPNHSTNKVQPAEAPVSESSEQDRLFREKQQRMNEAWNELLNYSANQAYGMMREDEG